MKNEIQQGEWIGQVERQASLIREQIEAMTAYVQSAGGGTPEIRAICGPYFDSLAKLYSEEFPLARAIEESDLLMRLEGFPVAQKNPRLSFISSIFTKVRRRVGGVAYAISGLVDLAMKNKEVDLGLSAFATGSLYLGFMLPVQDARQGGDLLGEEDPLYKATKEAIRTIGVVSQEVSSGADEATIAEKIEDPLVRDTAMAAVQDFSPSKRSGLNSVMITGRELPSRDFATLTPAIHSELRNRLLHPATIKGSDFDRFTGVIREIDLDLHRLALRRIVGLEIEEIRGIYPEHLAASANKWIDKSVVISGRVQRDKNGKPRMMHVESVEPSNGEGMKLL